MAIDQDTSPEYYPTETKIFNGVTYSVIVSVNQSRFTVFIGNGTNAIIDHIECAEVPAENYVVRYEYAHAYVQKMISSGDLRVKATIKIPGE